MMHVPFYSLTETHEQIKENIFSEIRSVIESGRFILGDKLKTFEEEFSSYTDVRYCSGVGSGLDAITISLLALGIKKGDEVIVSSHTFIATIQAIINTGADPVLIDTNPLTFNIDTKKVEAKITSRTKAILAVHMYGNPCDMIEIVSIADKYSLSIVEDFAQAVGAVHNRKKVGSIGMINATSFYPTKNLGAMGDAGGITTNIADLDRRVKAIRNYGSVEKYIHDSEGMNSRMDEIQSAILSVKLKYLDEWNRERNQIASIYTSHLSEIKDIYIPVSEPDSERVHHLYIIKTERRDQLKHFLKIHGIDTMIHYPVPVHLQKALSSLQHQKGSFPVSEEISLTCLSLPLYNGMEKAKIDYVIQKIKDFYILPH